MTHEHVCTGQCVVESLREAPRCSTCGKPATHRVVATEEGKWTQTHRYYCEECRKRPDAPFIQHL